MKKTSLTLITLGFIMPLTVAAEVKSTSDAPTKLSFSGRAQIEMAQY